MAIPKSKPVNKIVSKKLVRRPTRATSKMELGHSPAAEQTPSLAEQIHKLKLQGKTIGQVHEVFANAARETREFISKIYYGARE